MLPFLIVFNAIYSVRILNHFVDYSECFVSAIVSTGQPVMGRVNRAYYFLTYI